MNIDILDHGYVRLVTSWGDDLSPLEAARMSTGNATGIDEAKDDRLRRYLWEHGHHTPFEMAGLTVEIQAPIFVARQVFRHRQFSFNEFSGRYAEMPDLFYVPTLWRSQDGKNKQASGPDFPEERNVEIGAGYRIAIARARICYEDMIAAGVSREMARMVLPVSQYTRWRQQGNLRAWFHFLGLRLPKDVQPETQDVARAVAVIVKNQFPATWDLFEEGLSRD